LEVGIDSVLAIVVAIMLQWIVYGDAVTWAKAGGLTVAVYAFTIGRRYFMRRLFEMWSARQAMQAREDGGWKPVSRKRTVSRALRSYAALTRSAAFGAVRDPSLVE
jgi:hypothetical protein